MATIFTEEQLNAINSRNSNILVSASAGSGKTAVLVERIIKRIIDENLEVDKILVVTFTKAAAGELKERIYKAIKSALEKDKNNKHLRIQLRNLQIANITTIHSFCLDVIRTNFYKIGLDPNFNICDDTKSKLLKKESIEEVLESEYLDSKNQSFGLYNILELFNMDDKELISCINKMWDEISCYPNELKYLKEKIEKYNINNETEDLLKFDFGKEIFNNVISEVDLALKKSEEFRKILEKNDEFTKHLALLDEDIFSLKQIVNMKNYSWDKLYEVLSNISFSQMPRNKVSDEQLKEKFSSLRKEVIKKEIENAQKTIYAPSIIINNILKDMYKYLLYIYSFLEKVIKTYASKKNDEKLIDFTDIEHYALDILLEKDENGIVVPTLEAKNYISQFNEIYIDEYQDTSYMQEEILSSISKVNPGNRFMVGDIKQSIYKFRHAAVDIFIDKYNEYSETENEKGKKIILAKNFRSRKEVLAGINYIFEKIMSEKVGNCNYSGSEVLQVGNTKYIESNCSYNTEINFLDFNKEEINEDKEVYEKINELKQIEHEALHIASRIDKMVNRDKMLVMDENGNNLRNIRYSDICILLRSTKSKAEIYEKALKKASIPSYCATSSNILDGDEVNLILSFLKVLDNPLNEIEMISVMYSVYGRFTLDDIYKIKSVNYNLNIYDILVNWEYEKKGNEEIDKKIKEFINSLRNYISLVNVLPVVDILTKIYYETNLYNYILLLDNPNIRKINLDSLISIASNSNQNFNINEFLNYIENLKNGNITSVDSPRAISENENVVRIMTIHASKGLEFPVVILGGMDKKYSSEDVKSKVIFGRYGIGIDYIDEKLKISYPTVIKEAIKQDIIKANKSEELRMLYVALTRAREKIITYIPVTNIRKKLDLINIYYDEFGKIDSSISFSANSYRDIFMLALKTYIDNDDERLKNIFDINYIEINSEESLKVFEEYNNMKNINIPTSLLNINLEEKNNEELINRENEIEKICISENIISNVLRRTSVSELKKKQNDEENELLENKINKFIIPNKEDRVSSARKGTLIHLILENFVYEDISSIDDVKKIITHMQSSGKISNDEIKKININAFTRFIESDLFKEIKNSKYYKKEAEFVLKSSDFSESEIQGVIDLFFETKDGNIVLIDFKTDNIEDEEEFKKKYEIQLDIYKEALEKILERRVVKSSIYSFKLNKEIKM